MLGGGSSGFGGASNPVGGNNPAGIGATLNYIGNRVYAYSGLIDANDVATTLLKFTTGSEIIVGQIYVAMVTNSTDDFQYDINIDGQVAFSAFIKGGANFGMERNAAIPIILPPHTDVIITAQNATDTSTQPNCATITGKVV
jgi:hypothetical protein